MLLDRGQRARARSKMGHGVQSEVSNVGLLGKDESAEKHCGVCDDLRLGVDVNGEVNGFKQDGVLGVIMLYVLQSGMLARSF